MKFLLAMMLRDFTADATASKLAATRLVVQPAVYLFVFGYVIGGMLPMSGGNYAAVVAPGIIAIAVMTGPFVVVAGSILSGYYFRTMEGWLLAPATVRAILISKVTSGMVYGIVSGLIVALLVWGILGLAPQSAVAGLLVALAGSLLFSLFSLVILLFPQTPEKGQEAFSFLLMPMTFFGCTFYSYDMLEPPFSVAALLLPTTYISEGMRAAYGATGGMDGTRVTAGLLASAAVLFPLADWVCHRRLRDFQW